MDKRCTMQGVTSPIRFGPLLEAHSHVPMLINLASWGSMAWQQGRDVSVSS